MNLSLASKLPAVGTTIFTVMSQLAQEYKAINLSQGFPDFSADPRLVELVAEAMKEGHNQYANMAGYLPLREQVASLMADKYGATYSPESEVTITSGATEALYCAITALIKEGDEVIVIEPSYDSYIPAIQLSGGTPVCVQLEHPNYRINWDSVKRLMNLNTRAIILNTPHNPTGAILTDEDMRQLEKLISTNNIFVISDEVYEHIIFDGQSHASVAKYPGLRSRSLIISSFGKTFHTTGWKVGYCAGPEYLMREFRKVHQFVTFSTSTPFQVGIARYMAENRAKIDGLGAFYQQKRDYFLEVMKETRFKPLGCEGTYFQLMSYEGISDEKDTEFVKTLTREFGVAAIPVSVFYRKSEDNKVIRFCFAKEDETLAQAAHKLRKV